MGGKCDGDAKTGDHNLVSERHISPNRLHNSYTSHVPVILDQLPFIQIDDEKWLDFVCASTGFASLLSVAVTPASDKMARVLAKLRLRFCIQLLHTGFALPGAVTLWKKMKELILECMSMHEEVVMTGCGDG